eukprot:m.141528 g.141528  ORF g.141528 m.141528 type:complete len:73 (+) comp22863_c0_seq2:80-298(+)
MTNDMMAGGCGEGCGGCTEWLHTCCVSVGQHQSFTRDLRTAGQRQLDQGSLIRRNRRPYESVITSVQTKAHH